MQPRAIETRYKGYRFRSRLEARWAVFFNTLGLEWEYEPEGFNLSDGTMYLPDFRVGGQRGQCWFEVKPSNSSDVSKAVKFAEDGVGDIVVLDGPPTVKWYAHLSRETNDLVTFVDPGSKYGPWYFAWGEHSDRGAVPEWLTNNYAPLVFRAVDAARGARFEHGESGAKRG